MRELSVSSIAVAVIVCCHLPGIAAGGDDINADAAKSPVLYTSTLGPFYDASGSIETWIHSAVTYGTRNTVMAEVGPGEVLVGGGARVQGGYGLLTGSFPLIDQARVVLGQAGPNSPPSVEAYPYATKWVAQSRDHITASNHYLWVQAIGMKLRTQYPQDLNSYLSRDDVLKALRYTSSAPSPEVQYPAALVTAPAGFVRIISGGGRVIDPFNVGGTFLTGSYGAGSAYPRYWIARAKEHGVSSWARVQAYAISIINNTGRGDDGGYLAASVPNFGNFNLRWFHYNASGIGFTNEFEPIYFPAYAPGTITLRQPFGGYAGVYQDGGAGDAYIPYCWTQSGKPFVFSLTGVGANDDYQGSGRLLTGLWFYSTGTSLVITDKDHEYPDSTLLYPQAIMILKDSGRDYENDYFEERGQPTVMGNLETSP